MSRVGRRNRSPLLRFILVYLSSKLICRVSKGSVLSRGRGRVTVSVGRWTSRMLLMIGLICKSLIRLISMVMVFAVRVLMSILRSRSCRKLCSRTRMI